jgi:hypothetical protein
MLIAVVSVSGGSGMMAKNGRPAASLDEWLEGL